MGAGTIFKLLGRAAKGAGRLGIGTAKGAPKLIGTSTKSTMMRKAAPWLIGGGALAGSAYGVDRYKTYKAVERLKSDPNRIYTEEGAGDARRLYKELDTVHERNAASEEHNKKRQKALNEAQARGEDVSSYMKKWDRDNPSPDTIYSALSMAREEATGSSMWQGSDKWNKGFADSMKRWRDINNSANYVEDNAGNYGQLLGDQGFDHMKRLHGLVNDKASMERLKKYNYKAYEKLLAGKNKLNWAVNNRDNLRSLHNMQSSPFMWLISALFDRDPSRLYGATRSLNSAISDPNSDWYRFMGKDAQKYAAYLPWLNLLYNMRGAVSGDSNFTPISSK